MEQIKNREDATANAKVFLMLTVHPEMYKGQGHANGQQPKLILLKPHIIVRRKNTVLKILRCIC